MDDAVAPTLVGTPGGAGEELAPGASLGRYRLNARLGAGAMGEVWSARDPQLDREVAIKVVHPRLARSVDASQRLLREARAMAKLSHRAVVTVHDAGEVDGRLFLAMELVPGTTLGQLLRERTPAQRGDWQKWLAMMIEAGRGLAAAHRRGVLHRDFKPDNVLVDSAGRVCVGDFGLATLNDTPTPTSTAIAVESLQTLMDLTSTGALVGTPAYMSPEQLALEPATEKSDQFAFCVATYEALYGQRPFAPDAQGLGALTALVAAMDACEVPDPPSDSEVPRLIYDVLCRGLARSVSARWPTMDDLLMALDGAGKLDRAAAASVRRMTPFPARTRRARKRFVAVAAASVMVAVAAVVVVVTAWPRSPRVLKPRRLFDAPMRASLAISDDGRYLATASDRLEVFDLVAKTTTTQALPPGLADPITIHLQDDALLVSFRSDRRLFRWRYADRGSELVPITGDLGGYWFGRTVIGDIVLRLQPSPPHQLAIRGADGDIRSWPTRHSVDLLEVSPDRQRFTYLDVDRFYARIIVCNVVEAGCIESAPIAGATAITWIDGTTLVYASGQSRPTLTRVTVTDHFGPSEVIYTGDSGWYGFLVHGGSRLYMVDLAPRPRTRMVRRDDDSSSTQDLDASTTNAPLVWDSATAFLTWNRTNDAIERRSLTGSVELTGMALGGEPINATRANNLLIAAVRRTDGRDVLAYRIGEPEPLWRHELSTLAVRCAGDTGPPCYAAIVDDRRERLYAIDPMTGKLGAEVPISMRMEDFAVAPDGSRIAFVGAHLYIVEIAPDGTVISTMKHGLATARTIAFDPKGGYLIGGTLGRNSFQVANVTPTGRTTLAETQNDIILLARPSASGDRVMFLARVYTPSVLVIDL